MLEPEAYDAWLDPTSHDRDRLLDLLVPAAPGRLEAFPVAPLVSNVQNNGPELVAPLPLSEVPAEVAAQVPGLDRLDHREGLDRLDHRDG
jgi:hypothetical protein